MSDFNFIVILHAKKQTNANTHKEELKVGKRKQSDEGPALGLHKAKQRVFLVDLDKRIKLKSRAKNS